MNRIVDERITRDSNALAANAFWMMLMLQTGVLIGKLMLGAEIWVCLLDIVVTATGFIGMVILRTVKNLWGQKDDALCEIEQAGLAKLFQVMFWMLSMGEFLLIFMDEANMLWYVPFLLVWGIPALCFTIQSTRRGLLVWGGKKAEKDGKARLLKGTIIGAAFFGIIMGGPDCFRDGVFQWEGLCQVIAMGAFWGMLYYWPMRLLVRHSEKQADKAVEAAQESCDEE